MKPEELARQNIDRMLEASGWIIQSQPEMNIMAGLGVAVREFKLKSGYADYLLYVDGKIIGVIEAKPEGHTLTGVETQSAKYISGLPDGLPNHGLPLPFSYESTGTVTQFTNGLEPNARSREVFTFHRPDELLRLVKLDSQLRSKLQAMPDLKTGKLWPVQVSAIQNLEKSLSDNRPRALIQMTMGSGKTFTACSLIYRLIKFAGAKRILFLVDRNNLGRQTFNEFQQYISPYNAYKFTDEYNVQHLRRNTVDPASRVCITTIQRLYSMLKGEDEFEEASEEGSMFEASTSLIKEPLPVVYNPNIPIESFDFIITDECHRSIYNVWRQVLEYFDAFIVGLTATPTAQTIGFFNGNLVQEYTHEDAVADGVNVGYDVYRIATKITENGAKLAKKPGIFVPHRDRRTKGKKYKELDEDVTYTGNQLDRDVVSEHQIRLVVQTFRDNLFTDIFPGRTEVPKTLVFAKNDLHADDIVKIIREEFGKGNDFCQKITSKTTGKKPEELLAEFRNSFNPRIAVTVDMIATGTDVKSLECLLFMRNINSAAYFDQMKGRGSRIIDIDALRSVTPDAEEKNRFVIVDAIGVCENDKSASKPLDRKPTVATAKLLESVAKGMVNDDIVSTLGARLARLAARRSDAWHQDLADEAGKPIAGICHDLLNSIDPDQNVQRAIEKNELPEGQEPTEEQVKEAEQDSLREAVKPFHNPKVRDILLRPDEQVLDEQTQDELIRAEFDAEALEKAKGLITSFKQFIEDNKDEIEALQVLYSRPYRAGLRYKHVKELAKAIQQPPLSASPLRLWQAYNAVEPDQVKGSGGKQLVDVIALVRHALDPNQPLCPVGQTVEERFNAWLADQKDSGVEFTPEQMQWLVAIKDHIANSLSIDQDDFEYAPFSQFGGLGKAHTLFGDKLPTILEELNERLAA